jgi:hypothetical protein
MPDLLEQAVDQPLIEYNPRKKRKRRTAPYDIPVPYLPYTKHIALTKGKFAIVDAFLFEWLNQWIWYADRSGRDTWYAYTSGVTAEGRVVRIRMQRLIVGLGHPKTDKRIADHKNRNGLDNRGCNLRITDRRKNAFNRSIGISNKSGYKGVSRASHSNSWVAQITYKNVIYRSPHFPADQVVEAARARDQMAYLLHGAEFAVLNFPDETPLPPQYKWASSLLPSPQDAKAKLQSKREGLMRKTP